MYILNSDLAYYVIKEYAVSLMLPTQIFKLCISYYLIFFQFHLLQYLQRV